MTIVRRSLPPLLAIIGLAVAVACGSLVPVPTASPSPSVFDENMPAPGWLRLVGDPATAATAFTVALEGSDGERWPETTTFAVGQLVLVERISFAGDVALWVDNKRCAGTITLIAEHENDGVLRVGGGACEVASTRIHPIADDAHPDLFGSLTAEARVGTTLTLVSLDEAIPGEISDDADESGWISIDAVAPGRWAATLRAGDAELDERTITIEAGEILHLDLTP